MFTELLSATSVSSAFPGGDGLPSLEQALRRLTSGDRSWDLSQPLPSTREIGSRYGISNVSVCRLLKRLDGERILWQRENGRYYLYASRRLLERRKAYRCLLRAPASWTGMQPAILAGVGHACGEEPGSLLFAYDSVLAGDPGEGADIGTQREILRAFFRDDEECGDGTLLDDLWLDGALAAFPHRLSNAVIVGRTSSVPELSSVSMDFAAAALLGLAHLFARGFGTVWAIVPDRHSCATRQFAAAIVNAASLLGRSEENALSVRTVSGILDDSRQVLEETVDRTRLGLFCLDEATAVHVKDHLDRLTIPVPGRVGLISGDGSTHAKERNISTLVIDGMEIGRVAGELLRSSERKIVRMPPELVIRGTT